MAYEVGFIAAFYSLDVVLSAMGITLVLFVGLTLFTIQSKVRFTFGFPPTDFCRPGFSIFKIFLLIRLDGQYLHVPSPWRTIL